MAFSWGFFVMSLLAPPSSSLLLIVIGLILLRRRIGRWLIGVGIGSLYLLSTSLFAGWLAAGLETAPALTPEQIGALAHEAQAIVVPGAGRTAAAPEYQGHDVPSYYAAARLRYAADLYRQTGLPLAVSGGSVFGEHESEALIMARSLETEYVAPARWQEGNSRTTWENARNTAALLQPQGIRRIVLVTSAAHMRRAAGAFRHFGFEVREAPADFAEFGHEPLAMQLVPNAGALVYSRQALHEYVGWVWYAVKGLLNPK